jgi:hypothetical protein
MERCISACREKDRLGIRHGWCWACVREMRGQWRDEVVSLEAQRDELLAAAKEVAGFAVSWQPLTPGDISRLRAAIAKAEQQPA